MNEEPNWVFVVHKWETADGCHHVHVHENTIITTESFLDWKKALRHAEKKARGLGLKEYQVDSPRRPHVMVKV